MSQARQQGGQALTEYIVVTLFVVIALIAIGAEPTVIQQILDAIKSFFRAFSYVLSVAV